MLSGSPVLSLTEGKHLCRVVFASSVDFAEKPGVDGGAAVPPLRIMWNLPVFGRVRGPADL